MYESVLCVLYTLLYDSNALTLYCMKVLLLALESASANKTDFNTLNFYTSHFRTSPY